MGQVRNNMLYLCREYFIPIIIDRFYRCTECRMYGVVPVLCPFYGIVADVFLDTFHFEIVPDDPVIKTFLPDGYAHHTAQFIDPGCSAGLERADDVAEGFIFHIGICRDGRPPIPTNTINFPCPGMKTITAMVPDADDAMDVVGHDDEFVQFDICEDFRQGEPCRFNRHLCFR